MTFHFRMKNKAELLIIHLKQSKTPNAAPWHCLKDFGSLNRGGLRNLSTDEPNMIFRKIKGHHTSSPKVAMPMPSGLASALPSNFKIFLCLREVVVTVILFFFCSLPTQKFVENAKAKTFLLVKRGFIGGVIEWITNCHALWTGPFSVTGQKRPIF